MTTMKLYLPALVIAAFAIGSATGCDVPLASTLTLLALAVALAAHELSRRYRETHR